jgi:hypothetical protein
MEPMMSVVTVLVAVVAGTGLVLAGLFSVASLLWGDLLEREPIEESVPADLSTAA